MMAAALALSKQRGLLEGGGLLEVGDLAFGEREEGGGDSRCLVASRKPMTKSVTLGSASN